MPLKNENEIEKPRLIILSAPSGAGKTTLCERLILEDPSVRLSVSTTTRAKRSYEKEGTHYHFVTPAVFFRKIKEGEFAEWAEVHGNHYGTSKKTIEAFLKQGKNVLFDIDVQGALSLSALYPKRVLLIFIHPPSMQILEERLRNRDSDSFESIETRLENAKKEISFSRQFQYQIVNDELERAYAELSKIVERECR